MGINEIFESGFIKAFIAKYFELKIHSYYPEKHRLLYVLCNNDEEKQLVTAKQIELVKSEIQKLGYEELSFGYLFSCKPEYISGTDYVEPANRFKHWLNIFSKEYQNNTDTFLPILNSINNLKNDFGNEDFEAEFWEIYPNNQKPKESSLVYIIQREADLLSEIEFAILEFRKNEVWEIDFEEFKKFVEISKPIADLFNLSELLVQLDLLEMFNEFLLQSTDKVTKTKTDRLNAELEKHNFFQLPLIKKLSEPNKNRIIDLINKNGFPYVIALFDFLGFIKLLKSDFYKSNKLLFKELSDWFQISDRTVKGNIYVLNEKSNEDRKRYTADQHKEDVKNDYEALK
jgi:hypothetical protein